MIVYNNSPSQNFEELSNSVEMVGFIDEPARETKASTAENI